jgi:hypothetical protein
MKKAKKSYAEAQLYEMKTNYSCLARKSPTSVLFRKEDGSAEPGVLIRRT